MMPELLQYVIFVHSETARRATLNILQTAPKPAFSFSQVCFETCFACQVSRVRNHITKHLPRPQPCISLPINH